MISLKLGSSGPDVTLWSGFLVREGYLTTSYNYFGNELFEATKKFQENHGLNPDGSAGDITRGFASALKSFAPNRLRTEADCMRWLKDSMETYIEEAIVGTPYTMDWICAIGCRETAFLIVKYVNRGFNFTKIMENMRGDFTGGVYHGFSFFQIDNRSFPEFISAGDWKDPKKATFKAVDVLLQKRRRISNAFPSLSPHVLDLANTAGYNCGEGNVIRALKLDKGVDHYTTNKNYSSDVFRLRDVYIKNNI